VATKEEKDAQQAQRMADERVKKLEAEGASVEKLTVAKQKLAEANLANARAQSATDATMKRHIENLEAANKAVEENTRVKEANKKASEELKAVTDSFDTALEGTIRTFTGLTSGNETLIGSWMNTRAAAKELEEEMEKLQETIDNTQTSAEDLAQAEEDLAHKQKLHGKATESVTKKLSKYWKKVNSVASIISTVQLLTLQMAMANDKATAAFNASTGAAGAYDAELVSLQMSNRQNGISTSEMGDSYGALQASLSGFGVMAESERMRLGELGAQYAKVGVSGADFAGTIQTMTRTLGMSTQAATGMQEEAMELAQTLGKDVGTVMSELNQALPKLAAYGDDATKMFGELQKAAQRTGLEVGELMDMTSRYDTFDSAASAAGNLNAVLGTQSFGAMGFLESVREGGDSLTNYLTDTLQASGMAWESMDYYQRKAIANAADMDVATMSNLMNAEAQTQQEIDRAATLEESMAAGRDLWQELTIFAQNFAITITPLMNFLGAAINKVNGLFTFMREELTLLAPIARGIAVAFAYVYGAKAIAGMKSWLGINKGIFALAKAQFTLEKARTAVRGIWTALKGPVGLAQIAGGIAAGAAVFAATGGFDSHAAGTDSTSGRMALVGEEGPEGLVSPDGKKGGIVGANGPEFVHPPQGSAVINNTTMTSLASQATSRSVAGVGSSAAMAASIAALGGAMKEMSNRPIEVTTNPVMLKEKFRGGLQEATGGYGTQPIRLKTA
jgi:hypothetical protein|tara:strand:+ start:102 stop:2303 length:2202 start_codon:yes stop_codon:yes gene_type:complete